MEYYKDKILEHLASQAESSFIRIKDSFDDLNSSKSKLRGKLIETKNLHKIEMSEEEFSMGVVDGGYVIEDGIACSMVGIMVTGVGDELHWKSELFEVPHSVWVEDITRTLMLMMEIIVACNMLNGNNPYVMLDGSFENHKKMIEKGLDIQNKDLDIKNLFIEWRKQESNAHKVMEEYHEVIKVLECSRLLGNAKLVTTHQVGGKLFGDNHELWPIWAKMFDDKQTASVLLEPGEYMLYPARQDGSNTEFILLLKPTGRDIALKITLPITLICYKERIIKWISEQVVGYEIEEPYNIWLADKLSKEAVTNQAKMLTQIWTNMGGFNYERNYRTI